MAALLILGAGCARSSWGSLDDKARSICERHHAGLDVLLTQMAAGSAADAKFLRSFRTPKDEYVRDCTALVSKALAPCTEYAYGSDRGLECSSRRAQPALELAVYSSCAKHATPGEIHDACVAEVAARTGQVGVHSPQREER